MPAPTGDTDRHEADRLLRPQAIGASDGWLIGG